MQLAGAVSAECRYDIGLEERCARRGSPEAASTIEVQDLLGLVASSIAPLLFTGGGGTITADVAPMVEWETAFASGGWHDSVAILAQV